MATVIILKILVPLFLLWMLFQNWRYWWWNEVYNKFFYRCPFLGCSCISFTIKDLEEDDEIALRITQNSARQRESEETDTEDEETEDESNDSPNVGSVDDNAEIDVETGDNDTENADTQSQELLWVLSLPTVGKYTYNVILFVQFVIAISS